MSVAATDDDAAQVVAPRDWAGEFAVAHVSVPEARRTAERLLPRLGFNGDLEAARMIVSELMTNAVLHGAGDGSFLVLRLAPRADGALVVEVVDNSPATPRPAAVGGVGREAESGRGLLLVAALGARVTWAAVGDRKTVRALLPSAEGTR
ncbi:ATP-binding protein [Streptomyces sp. NEAU-H3]|nr:ATP-binding protein [Streptomyces sp. NEAU-H3]